MACDTSFRGSQKVFITKVTFFFLSITNLWFSVNKSFSHAERIDPSTRLQKYPIIYFFKSWVSSGKGITSFKRTHTGRVLWCHRNYNCLHIVSGPGQNYSWLKSAIDLRLESRVCYMYYGVVNWGEWILVEIRTLTHIVIFPLLTWPTFYLYLVSSKAEKLFFARMTF